MGEEIVSQNEYIQQAWNLEDLFTSFDAPEVEQSITHIERQIEHFEAYRSRLNSDLEPTLFHKMLEAYERLVRDLYRLTGYSSLRFAADTQDQNAQTSMARYRQLAAETDNRTMFFQLWWKELEDESADSLLASSRNFRYWLELLRLERLYTLSEPEERVINLKDVNGTAALLTLYSTTTDRYIFKLTEDGEKKELNREELAVYYRHSQPDMRAAAYQELFRVYERDLPVLGQIYQYRLRDWQSENVDLRGYSSPISVRNLNNDIPDEAIDVLLEVGQENASLFQRYFRLKAQWIGMKKLRRYDIYAPVLKTDRRYDYSEAVELVLESFRRFDPRIAALAERVFQEQHIDSEVRKGKSGGAFCATISPDLTPWVLQSFTGRPDDVATMAHELGHAIHAMLASHHNALSQQASLPLAETASTFGEMLVIGRILAEDPDPDTRRDLLFRQMDSNYATIMRQIYFALFERDAHQLVAEGALIDDLSDLYIKNLSEQFGDSLELNEEFKLEWILIPHIYRVPFYVYAYSFGQLLVLSLYQQFLEEGESFKPRYLEILSAGGSVAPVRILQKAGIDIRSADFWQGGFDVLRASLEQLESFELPSS
jgi:oligoendopeptidase F